jgi:hypothetical protein
MIGGWLRRRLTIYEAEEKYLVYDKRLGSKGIPFGFSNEKWVSLKSKMVDGDQLWEFSSPPATWACLGGREGIALVRQGKIIDAIITRMN